MAVRERSASRDLGAAVSLLAIQQVSARGRDGEGVRGEG